MDFVAVTSIATTNIVTISSGSILNINPTSPSPGIAIGSGTSAFIDAAGAGATLQFSGATTADGLSVEASSGGTFNISTLTTAGVSIGQLIGDANGTVNLGARNLTSGSSNSFTSFLGTITGSGGSMTKVGTGALTLGGANTYTGGTDIQSGTLAISDSSALGTGAVTLGNASSSSAALNVSGLDQ